jgi:uncharacterized membrane protein
MNVGFHPMEAVISNAAQWLRLLVETIGALVVGIGVVVAIWTSLRALLTHQPFSFNQTRLSLARYLALALEFQLGADILSTAIAPSWDQIGKLGAIAVIRTALNFFLMHEMQEERAQSRGKRDSTPDRVGQTPRAESHLHT